ncbi:MAG: DUF1343 domain-containing protein [Ignavibacteriales bacterium CG_4_9_14_3_um_filter_34_10]|nr:MAG: DUF1343 domain-containing protein [Ignavibacteriales bacterium CG_4_9_14_3_um_filter_34_10]
MISRIRYLVISILLYSNFTFAQRVIPGAEVLLSESIDLIKGKNIGVVTNHSAILFNRTHLVDSLSKIDGVKIIALFGPEHGIRGDAPDGKKISSVKDEKTGAPIYSLYGEINKPTPEMLSNIDVLLFDIQDVGARFYTYISTLYYCIEACAENNIPLIVLDRPNPIGGNYIDGPVREPELKSFVSIIPVPISHGMTIGEIALMINEELWTNSKSKCELTVIKMKNWSRSLYFDECNLPWIKPSPNITNVDSEILYPGLCLIEGTNLSEGRGTQSPFLQIGAPFIKPDLLFNELNKYNIPGIEFDTISFVPISIPNMSDNPKHKNQLCHGLKFSVTDRQKFESVKFGVSLIYAINKLFPNQFEFRKSIDRLYGKSDFKEKIRSFVNLKDIYNEWKSDLFLFESIREKYLLY